MYFFAAQTAPTFPAVAQNTYHAASNHQSAPPAAFWPIRQTITPLLIQVAWLNAEVQPTYRNEPLALARVESVCDACAASNDKANSA